MINFKECSDKIHQAGGVAAPVGGQIFSEILPYLEVNQGNAEEIEVVEEIQAPDLLGKTLDEAQKLAKENEIELVIENETELVIENETEELDKKSVIVKEQIPKAGITIKKGSKIYIKYE